MSFYFLTSLAFNLKSLNNNASALIEARGQSAPAGVRSALENVQDLHYYAESPLGHVMRYVLALTDIEFFKYFFRVLHEASSSWLKFLLAFQLHPVCVIIFIHIFTISINVCNETLLILIICILKWIDTYLFYTSSKITICTLILQLD
jgi:hypothetical protein